jgi:acyl carrier protein
MCIRDRNFGFKVKAEEMANVRTLQDFYDYVIANVNKI